MNHVEKPLMHAFPGQDERIARRSLALRAKEKAIKRDADPIAVRKAFEHVPFFLGITAVHGVEPQQIAVNTAMAINKQLTMVGLEQRPILIPYLPGHPSYGKTTVEVLRNVYPDNMDLIYLSEDLGRALSHTEFGTAGYQPHWQQVVDHQPQTQQELLSLVGSEFRAIRLDGVTLVKNRQGEEIQENDNLRKTFDLQKGEHALEINAGANASAATESGSVVAHSVFPTTLDGLVELVSKHPDIFDFDPALVGAIGTIANALRAQFTTIVLPGLHTMAQEEWFTTLFPDVFLTPPLKEKLTPPVVRSEEKNGVKNLIVVTKDNQGKEVAEIAQGYDKAKGIIHINISGSGLGSDSAKRFAIKAAEDGYVIAAPRWIIDGWHIPQGSDSAKRMIRVGPEILFAKDENGANLCGVFFMRPGMGSYAYAQLAEVPMLVIGYSDLENPEMWGNTNVITANGLGRRYTGRPDTIPQTIPLQTNIAPYNARIYKEEGIPEDMGGLEYTARVIIAAEIERQKAS